MARTGACGPWAALVVVAMVPMATAHPPPETSDTHAYAAGALGDFAVGCHVEEDVSDAPEIGGTCFDLGIDVTAGTSFSITVTDDIFPYVAYRIVVEGPSGSTDHGSSCGYGGAWTPLPAGATRVWVFLGSGAGGYIGCYPATTGSITITVT